MTNVLLILTKGICCEQGNFSEFTMKGQSGVVQRWYGVYLLCRVVGDCRNVEVGGEGGEG